MKSIKILWADDEIELLKPHIIFLESKGYSVTPVHDGANAIEKVSEEHFDIVFLDEQMPGISGIDALSQIKQISPDIPVIMITKSEAEDIMEAAIGSKISDYLIKPVNPNQILLTLKKNLESKHLITQETTSKYQIEFSQLGIEISNAHTWEEWIEVYKKISFWELQLEQSKDRGMDEVLHMQKLEANLSFAKYIQRNYLSWFANTSEAPILSQTLIKNRVFNTISPKQKTMLLVIDNLRYDHWLAIRPLLKDLYTIDVDSLYFSILPTTTQYARNALFSGLMPSEIAKLYPDIWKNDDDDEGKNKYEEQLLTSQLKRLGYTDKFFFEKISAIHPGRKITEKLHQISQHQFSVIVYNFVDTLSHSRTEMDIIKELASNESAYRSLILSWFQHSALFELIRELAHNQYKLIITTDHGSIRVQNPIKVIGDKSITTNLRYKQGKALQYNPKEVFEIKKPQQAFLPTTHMHASYIFAQEHDFFAYPNNFNHYAKYYRNSFQHGGISMEEMIIPYIELTSKHSIVS
ncbi:MAG: PglZ domain-containing protein [Bacteroidales bacterium]|nr:PglZ domain-containing protein [Bacteroidales bacterium]